MPSRRVLFRVAAIAWVRIDNILRTLRSQKTINAIGLGLVGVVGLWLFVNFLKGPEEFVNVGLDGLTRGAVYGVVALGYTLVYGILQLINFAHGDVFALSGLVASTVIFSVLGLSADSSGFVVVGGILVTLAITIPCSRSSTARSSESRTGRSATPRG